MSAYWNMSAFFVDFIRKKRIKSKSCYNIRLIEEFLLTLQRYVCMNIRLC